MRNLLTGCAIVMFGLPIAAILGLAIVDPDLLEQLFWWTVYGLGGAAVLAFLVTIAVLHNRAERRERTFHDGLVPMLHIRHRWIWRRDLPWEQAIVVFFKGNLQIIDRNMMPGGNMIITPLGEIQVAEPPMGWDRQLAYVHRAQMTRDYGAIFVNHETASNMFGRDIAPPRLPAAAMRPRVEPPLLPPPMDDEQPQLVEPAMTPATALERSQNGVVYIGQASVQSGHQLAKWDANSASTLGIFGANGTGKTSSVATMVTLAMVRWGWKLWILDGKDAGDWDEFSGVAAVAPVAQHNIEDVMEGIWEEYQRRESLMSEYRARRYHHLPDDVQAEFPQWGVVFEEFGATRLALSPKTREHLDRCMGILCQKARYTGWHGVFIDQRPSDYTNEMKGNLKSIACFKLLMNQGHAVNAYQAGTLADVGEFEMDGQRYFAFHAEPLARPVLASLPVREPFIDMPATNGYERPTNGYERQAPEANGANVRKSAGGETAPTLVSIYERTRSWDAVAESFFKRDPTQTQSDLRRLMVLISADGRGQDAFKGEAHRLYHTYNPNGQNYQGA